MKKPSLVICAMLALGTSALGALPTLTFSDFTVHSDNPKYKYVGKGLSEMIAVELRHTPGVALVERERRAQLLEEASFLLSDLADPDRIGEIGRMLSADYIVFGEIVDLGDEVLVSLRMADVRTGSVVWNEKLTERLSRYDYIAGYFARSILESLGIGARVATAEKVAQRKEKDIETVVVLSSALDHLDKRETDEAKREAARARRLDPGSEAVDYVLSKLVVNTAKFKALLEPYYSYRNPAYLGILRADYLHVSGGAPAWILVSMSDAMEGFNCIVIEPSDTYFQEWIFDNIIGYAFPLGDRWGLGIDLRACGTIDRFIEAHADLPSVSRNLFGGVVDAGFQLSDRWSVGAGLGVIARSSLDSGPLSSFIQTDRFVASCDLGFLYRRPDESLIMDARIGWNSETYDIIDTDTYAISDEVLLPVFEEATMTLALDERRAFLSIRQSAEVCLDRVYYYATVMPVVERFLGLRLSIRAGLEGSYAVLGDASRFGYGGILGGTVRSPSTGFEVGMNLTYRLRPSRAIEGVLYPDYLYMMNFTWNDRFVSRAE